MNRHRDPVIRFEGPAIALPLDNVDTDQIIPARFLKTTSRSGLGGCLFADWRVGADGREVEDFILNQPAAHGARLLVTGRNFGCGSSREHAPWALTDFGFRAVIAASFADIFRQNALRNGLLPIVLPVETHASLLRAVGERPGTTVGVDLERQVVRLPDQREASFSIDPFARACLLGGLDEIGYVLQQESAIDRFEGVRDQNPASCVSSTPDRG